MISLLNYIKTSVKHNRSELVIPRTRINLEILLCLYRNGYLVSFTIMDNRLFFNVVLKMELANDLSNLRRYSKVTASQYLSFTKLYRLNKLYKMVIVSTSQGVIMGNELFFYGIGGKVLFVS